MDPTIISLLAEVTRLYRDGYYTKEMYLKVMLYLLRVLQTGPRSIEDAATLEECTTLLPHSL